VEEKTYQLQEDGCEDRGVKNMIDIDKIRKGVECCFHGQEMCGETECPYWLGEDMCCVLDECQENFQKDVKALLDRFEPVSPGIVHDIQGVRYECGVCRATLWVQKDTVTLPYNMRAHRFCSNCGRMVKMGD